MEQVGGGTADLEQGSWCRGLGAGAGVTVGLKQAEEVVARTWSNGGTADVEQGGYSGFGARDGRTVDLEQGEG